MLIKLLGVLWIILALTLLINPQAFRAWIIKNKDNKSLIFLPLTIGAIFIFIGISFEGVLAKIILVFGILGIVKTVILLNRDFYNKLVNWTVEMPVSLFRIGACFHLIIGFILLSL